MEFNQLKNGEAKTNTGLKEVAFDPDTLELRPVLFRIFSGYQPSRGTIQGVKEGDFIAQCCWNSKGADYRIYRYGSDNVDINKQAELWIKLREKHTWLDAWLEPSERSETVIPNDIIPESEYLSNKVKLARITNAIERFGLPYTPSDFTASKKGDLKLVPSKLEIDLDHHIPQTNLKDNANTYEEWYGSTGTGNKAALLDSVPCVTDDWGVQGGEYGVKGWKKWKFIIRVVHGVHTEVGGTGTYGKSLFIWENTRVRTATDKGKK